MINIEMRLQYIKMDVGMRLCKDECWNETVIMNIGMRLLKDGCWKETM
jgi:hypothetical protein